MSKEFVGREIPVTGFTSQYGYWVLTQVNPELAAKWLEQSKDVRNRTTTLSRVAYYAKQMREGNWRVTHQGIAFDEQNHLTDGKHRLTAICQAGVTVDMWVYYGLSQKSMIAVDKHRPRTEQNSLYISGMDVTRHDVTTARSMSNAGSGYVNIAASSRLAGDELAAYIERHRAAIDFSVGLFKANSKGVSSSPVRGLVARAFYTHDPERIAQFINILYTGMVDHPQEDSAAVRVRNFLQENSVGAGTGVSIVYKKVSSGLLAFLQKRPLTKLYEASEELFPIPGE